jgi:peptidoglycan/xylan/chitin deacetylase (PgdA/CDA1 family)
VTHPRLADITAETVLSEMVASRHRLESMLGIEVRHFAYPYGRSPDCGPRDYRLAQNAGFASATTTSKGLLLPGKSWDRFALPRVTLNGHHQQLNCVDAHLSGLSALGASVIRRR